MRPSFSAPPSTSPPSASHSGRRSRLCLPLSLVLLPLLVVSAVLLWANRSNDRGVLRVSSLQWKRGSISAEPLLPSPPPTAAAAAGSPPPLLIDVTDGDDHKVATSIEQSTLKARKDDLKLKSLEVGLARARSAIRRSIRESNQTSILNDSDYVPRGPVYRNAYAFHRSYLEMEKLFKVYVYEEGEPPLFHDGPCWRTYSTEGRFIYNMEIEAHFRTSNPDKAHVYFLPFSITKMVRYERDGFNIASIHLTINDYIHVIKNRHPYWNRSRGADHFMISCHDWGPKSTAAYSQLYSNSIRVLCNANTSEGFNPIKDVSLPEMNFKTNKSRGFTVEPPPTSDRPLLAFFAGRLHGGIRGILLNHWKDKDDDIQVFQSLPKRISYADMMRKSKFCLCPSGYEVASPRIVEAIYHECVPVILSDQYVLPFSDVLNWEAFSVRVAVDDIPNLKNILTNIPQSRYAGMQMGVKVVQRHFMAGTPPQRFDMFHMILHSVWLRRLNIGVRIPH